MKCRALLLEKKRTLYVRVSKMQGFELWCGLRSRALFIDYRALLMKYSALLMEKKRTLCVSVLKCKAASSGGD